MNHADQPDSLPEAPSVGERFARLLLTRSPLGALVRRVARIRASVHAKLLGAFLLIALLLIAMAVLSLQAINSVARQSRLLDQAHQRVEASRQIANTVSAQMNFIRNAVLLRDEVTIESILRESDRFGNTLAVLDRSAASEEKEAIQRIREVHTQVLSTVGAVATLIRAGKVDEAMTLHLNESQPLYREVTSLVTRVVQSEEAGMASRRPRSSSRSCSGSSSPGPSSCPFGRPRHSWRRSPRVTSARASTSRIATSSAPWPRG